MNLMPTKNFAATILAHGINDRETALIVIDDVNMFPDPETDGDFEAVIWDAAFSSPHLDPAREIVLVTQALEDTMIVIRGQGQTLPSAHNTPNHYYRIAQFVTSKMFDDIEQAIKNIIPPIDEVTSGQELTVGSSGLQWG